MGYVEAILEPGEVVRYRTTLSWTVYLPGLLLAVVALAFFAIGSHLASLALWLLAAALGIVALLLLVRAWFQRYTTEIAITDRRLILKQGFIRRHTVEVNLRKVGSVDVDQTVLGRIFNFGDVTVQIAGGAPERLPLVDSPLKLRSTVTAG